MNNRKKKYLGSINSTVKVLAEEVKKHLRQGYNQIVIDRGKSFHDCTVKLWMVKGNNNIDQLETLYKKAVIENLALFGLSRKSEQGDKFYNKYMEKYL